MGHQHQHGSSCSLQSYDESASEQSDMTPPTSPLHCKPELILASLPPSPGSPCSTTKILSPHHQHQHGQLGKLSPEAATSSAGMRILGALTFLIAPPFLLYNCLPASTVSGNLHIIKNVWDSLLKISCTPIALGALVTAVYFGPCCLSQCGCLCNHDSESTDCVNNDRMSLRLARWTGCSPAAIKTFLRRVRSFVLTTDGLGFTATLVFLAFFSITASMPLIVPGWGWYPLAWGEYKVYQSADLASALDGLCLNQDVHDIRLPRKSWAPSLGFSTSTEDRSHLPLCLKEDSWNFLSAGGLSSTKPHDVRTVLKGIQYAQGEGAGLAIAVLARDIVDLLPNLKENVASLAPFFPELSVVVFENDSKDGSREAFREWAADAEASNLGYHVDLMECEEAEDCKFGKKHRDLSEGGYGRSKAVGDMDIYRQRVTDYITDAPLYADYSHMLVLDIDLGISLSPLGLLHSLGERPDNAVASSGRQLVPGAWGTLATPYDFSAFRPWATETNHWVLSMHERWCGIMPPGDRWRNACDAMSPFLFSEAFRMDRATTDNEDFYRVESAFNGVVVYPLDLIRDSEATYDAGDDGQRCEHIGFNLALKKPMYVNRRWDMHLDPNNPGGPTGWRAKNAIAHVSGTPRIFFWVFIVQLFGYAAFVHSITTLGVHLVYPLMAPLLVGSQSLRRLLSSRQRKRRRIRNGREAEETLLKLV